eukprot:757451-Hanusia_phi.AAC.2
MMMLTGQGYLLMGFATHHRWSNASRVEQTGKYSDGDEDDDHDHRHGGGGGVDGDEEDDD